MPITPRAEKKLRHDRKRTIIKSERLYAMRLAVKAARKTPTAKAVSTAFKALDKAVKTKTIHHNKAARIKSRLARLTVSKK